MLLGYIRGPLQGFDWTYSWLDLISMIAMVVVLIAGIRLVPASYSSYSAAGLIFAMSTGVAWFSASRHALALFPLIIVLAVIGWRYRAVQLGVAGLLDPHGGGVHGPRSGRLLGHLDRM